MKTYKQLVNESSLSRIWRHTQDHQSGAISGYRGGNNKAQNQRNNSEISSYLRRKGYSVTKISGNYIEDFGTPNAREVGEPSFFVVDINDTGNLEKDLAALGRAYNQDSVLIVPKGGKGAYLLGTNNSDFPGLNQTVKVGNSKYGKVAGEFLSRISGREFAFESVEPMTRNGKYAMAKLAEEAERKIAELET